MTVEAHFIAATHDVLVARRSARDMAKAWGFDATASEEVAIVVTELGTNLVSYASEGTITIVALDEDGRRGIEIEAIDSGVGIPDVEEAMRDGFSTGGSAGKGLGAVNRLMAEFDIRSPRGTQPGTQVTARKWLPGVEPRTQIVDVGVATRARLGGSSNGDSFVQCRLDDNTLVGVIDGVGHGLPAQEAAQAARHFIESHASQPFLDLIQGADRACRHTRGVVVGLARFEHATKRCTVAGIGNIEMRLVQEGKTKHVTMRRGVVGKLAPKVREEQFDWDHRSVLVMHSDGLSTRWRGGDIRHIEETPASMIADDLMRRFGLEDDDATVLVAKANLR